MSAFLSATRRLTGRLEVWMSNESSEQPDLHAWVDRIWNARVHFGPEEAAEQLRILLSQRLAPSGEKCAECGGSAGPHPCMPRLDFAPPPPTPPASGYAQRDGETDEEYARRTCDCKLCRPKPPEPSGEEWIGELEELERNKDTLSPYGHHRRLKLLSDAAPRLLRAARKLARYSKSETFAELASLRTQLAAATATIARAEALPALWMKQQAEYPARYNGMPNEEACAEYAAAAVRCCARELSAALTAHPSTEE